MQFVSVMAPTINVIESDEKKNRDYSVVLPHRSFLRFFFYIAIYIFAAATAFVKNYLI